MGVPSKESPEHRWSIAGASLEWEESPGPGSRVDGLDTKLNSVEFRWVQPALSTEMKWLTCQT